MRNPQEIRDQLLKMRGCHTAEEISEFLSDKPKKTYDPFLLLNMRAGVDLLLSEINSGKTICIYGDYDADGVTSVCILSHVIGQLTDRFFSYIPSRFEEGYGLNESAVRKVKEQGADLILTVDCGSVSYAEVELAKSLGMKVIVTDHHNIDDRKADCILINPKQQECTYPFRELAGCGVAFKLAQAIQKETDLPKSVLHDVLDLVAVGTVGDIVSLTDENRTMVKYGLYQINGGRRPAMTKLMKAISLKQVSSENIAFGIAPHINAAGRMASADEAVKLFLSNEVAEQDRQIEKLIRFNQDRKREQQKAFDQCLEQISGKEDFILLKMEHIHEGIGGIVAGKIKEQFQRPAVIVTPSGDGLLKGTGRSIPSVDIYRLLKKQEELLERFGGHRSACGFLMRSENLSILRRKIQNAMNELKEKDPALFDAPVQWDLSLEPEEITLQLAEQLDTLEPFGEGNPRPAFLLSGVQCLQPRFMGAEQTHVRFTAQSERGGRAVCVLFQKAQEKKELLQSSQPVDVVGTVSRQSWQGRESVQLIVEEIRPWKSEEKNL